jgi:15-cis-phytoene synthase
MVFVLDSVAGSYSLCRRITKQRAGNFYYSFLLLSKGQRDGLCAVYSFMRYCDDLADGEGNPEDKWEKLEQWRSYLTELKPRQAGGPVAILPAFNHALTIFGIPRQYFHDLIDGVEMDLHRTRYADFRELREYCYRVASTVGMVCTHIFGSRSREALASAEECGIAFQLTNILRDVKEDALRGRIYLPLEDLKRFDYGEDELLQMVYDERFVSLMAFQTERAKDHYRRALPLLKMLRRRSRAAVGSLILTYSSILNKIEGRSFDVFTGRASISKARKIMILVRSLSPVRDIP